ncbi:MAG: methyltransferase domain-containing protein [Candidatus Riflebacteria bacterium]|nr:methyltransferase domain-containing protein [Candidatus Riflebacteria bacterium]
MSFLSKFFDFQKQLSLKLEKVFPKRLIIDGNTDFINSFIPKFLKKEIIVCDVGGGRTPFLKKEVKSRLNIKLKGIDKDIFELNSAPNGIYDEKFPADISLFRGKNDVDLLICQAVLEHVKEIKSAFVGLRSLLKKGGIALIFVPSKNAVYAKLNMFFPSQLKQFLLFNIYPESINKQGHEAFYKNCTPLEIKKLASETGFQIIESRFYYTSYYFTFLFPLHLLWRFWTMVIECYWGVQGAETFSIAFKAE